MSDPRYLEIQYSSPPTDLQVPLYDAASDTWVPATVSAAGAYSATTPIVLTGSVFSHALSGVSAGTYRSVTVNVTGHVTAGSNPTIDISGDTNLAVTSPITLTGDTVGFDSTANFTWTGTHSFNNIAGITLSSTSPIITLTDTSASEDDFTISLVSGGFLVQNTTDSVTALSVGGTGVNTYNVSTGNAHIFNVNNAEELRIAANRMTFNNGASDTYLDWSTNGRLDLAGNRVFFNAGATIASSAITPHSTGYELSVQSNGGFTYIEILNSYGTGAGAFFGMEGSGIEGDVFSLWNYQGGPIHFFTAPTAIDGTVTFKISEDADIGVRTDSQLYLQMDNIGTLGNAYISCSTGNVMSHNVATGGSYTFLVNSSVEATLAADTLTFNNGATDTGLSWGTSGILKVFSGATNLIDFTTGATVFNEDSADLDFRFEGNADANLLFLDAGNDRVGIGNASPSYKLDVTGQINATEDIAVPSDKKIYLEGMTGDTYISYVSSSSKVQHYVNGVLTMELE